MDFNYLHQVNGCPLESKIKSIKIPGGLKVTGFKEKKHTDRRYGPYTGPLILNTIDAPGTWKSYKIEKVENKKARRRGFYKIHKRKHKQRSKNHKEEMAKEMTDE